MLAVRLMSTPCKSAALARAALLGAMGSLAAWGTHCNYNDYPLEPTFCDDWCRVLLRPSCDQEPENCVRMCERSLAPAQCGKLAHALLDCYEQAPATEFACSGSGFQRIVRPEEHVCPSQRDQLIGCAYPHVKQCLDVCRQVRQSFEAGVANDAAVPERTCPSGNVPCDSVCWAAAGRLATFGTEDAEAGALEASRPDAGTDVAEAAHQLISCAVQRAEVCRSAQAADASPDASPAARANWTSVLLQCLREPAPLTAAPDVSNQ
jgi:hypothetical protein